MPAVITPCGGGALPQNVPRCLVYNSTNQSIGNNTLTLLTFDSERFDNDSMHSPSVDPERITFNTAGTYAVFYSVIWFQNNTGERVAQALLNGTTGFIWASQNAVVNTPAVETTRQTASGLIDVVVGDYIVLQVKQLSGGALDCVSVTVPTGLAPVFGAVWVG